MRTALVVPIAALTLGACMVGPNATEFARAMGPRGVAATLTVKGARVQGELLDARDTAVVVMRDCRVLFVPLEDIVGGTVELHGMVISGGRYVSKRAAERLRRLARFPAGLSPEGWATLLASCGQTTPDRVSP